jgi:hypothetical protein
MRKIITHLSLLILLLSVFIHTKAQQQLGRTNSNYAGTYGVYQNASSIADNKYLFYFNFWGRGVNFYNNYLDYNAPIKLNKWANSNYPFDFQKPDGNPDYKKDWLLENLNGKDKYFSFNQDIWGPAMMFPLSKKISFAINTRQRSGLQIFGISEPVARLLKNGVDSSSGIYSGNGALQRNTTYNNGAFGVNAQSYQELSFTLGTVLHKSTHHQLNGGVTFKFLRGLGASYIKGSNLGVNISDNNSAIINGDFEYAYTDNQSIIDPFNNPYGLFSLNARGAGAGIDLGFNYTYRSKRLKYANRNCNYNDKKSDYDFKLAMAFNDIGGIRYNKNSYNYQFNSATGVNVTAPSNILDPFKVSNQNAMDTIGNRIFGQMGATRGAGFNTSLPAAFNLQADFRLTKHIYTTVNWNQSLKPIQSSGLQSTSMLSVIPRIESRGFEFSMPLTLSENYQNFYLGAYARIGPVFFGSDNLGGLLNVSSNSQFRGADIYGGVSFGIGHCHKYWYENKVDPVFIDTVGDSTIVENEFIEKHDTLIQTKTDTVRIVVKDTMRIIKKDTVFIDRTNNIERERQYKRREDEIIRRQRELERREREILERERNVNTQPETCITIRNQNTTLTNENRILRERELSKDREIDLLKRELELEKQKNKKCETDLLACKNCPDELKKKDAEIIVLKQEIETIKKNDNNTFAEIIKKTEQDKKKAENDAIIAKRERDSINNLLIIKQTELDKCKIDKSTGDVKKCEEEKANLNLEIVEMLKTINRLNTRVYNLSYKSDSLGNIVVSLRKELEDCKKNANTTNAEIIKKAEADKAKAEADKAKAEAEAEIAKKKAEETNVLLIQKTKELEECKKNSNSTSAEIVKKAEADKAKAEAEAEIAKKKAEETNVLLIQKTKELEECKKNATSSDAEIVKKAEADKVKAEADKAKAEAEAEIAKKKAEETNVLLIQKTKELEECKKNATSSDAEIVKKAEADKAKAEAEAEIAKNKAEEANVLLVKKTAELAEKDKKCQDEKALLQIEMKEMLATINRLNTKNNALSYKVDSLVNELKNCSKSGSSCEQVAQLLKECNKAEAELKAEIVKLNNIIKAKDKSIDSSKAAAEVIRKKELELNAQVVKLNSEIETLKANNKTEDCETYKKQLDEKNAEIVKLKKEKTDIQNNVNQLNEQLNEYKAEYNFMLQQSNKCKRQLDSCKLGLYDSDIVPDKKGDVIPPTGGSGPYNGGKVEQPGTTTPQPNTEKKTTLGSILKGVMEAAAESSNTPKTSSPPKTNQPSTTEKSPNTNTNTGATTGTKTGTNNGSPKTGNGTSTSSTNNTSTSAGSTSGTSTSPKTGTSTSGTSTSGTSTTQTPKWSPPTSPSTTKPTEPGSSTTSGTQPSTGGSTRRR